MLTKQEIEEITPKRGQKAFKILDIAAPRDTDPEINTVKHVILYSMEDFTSIIEQNREMRLAEIAQVETIKNCEIEKYFNWYHDYMKRMISEVFLKKDGVMSPDE